MNTLLFTVLFLFQQICITQDSNSKENRNKLIESLSKISKYQSHILNIDHLLHFTRTDLLTPTQTKQLWEFLWRKDIKIKDNKILLNTEEILNYGSFFDSVLYEMKIHLSFNQIMLGIMILMLFSMFPLVFLIIFLYRKERFFILLIFSLVLSYNGFLFVCSLQSQIQAVFLSGIFCIIVFILSQLVIHIIFLYFGIQGKLIKIKDLFNYQTNFKGKCFQTILAIFFSYFLSIFCESILIQIPFYISIYYLCYLICCKYEYLFPFILSPFWLSGFILLSYIFLIVIYLYEEKSFQINLFGKYLINPDLQYFGIIIPGFIINYIFPIWLFFQLNSIKNSKTKEMSFKLIYKKYREEMSKDNMNIEWNSFEYHITGITQVLMILLGFKLRVWFFSFTSIFCLLQYMMIIMKESKILWKFLFYILSFFVINCIFFLGKMEDQFMIKIISIFQKDNILIYLAIGARIFLLYYSMDSVTSLYALKEEDSKENDEENEVEEEKTIDELEVFFEILISLTSFILTYLFVVYLTLLANEETSIILSFGYMCFGLISITKLLIYYSLSKDEINRTLVSLLIYISGFRISFLQGKIAFPLYFGCLIANLSVFASYISFKNIIFMFVSFFMLFGLFVQGYFMQSSLAIILAFSNLALLISFLASKNGSTIIWNFLLVFGLFLIVIFFDGLDLKFTYSILDFLIKKIVPFTVIRFFEMTSSLNELPENQFVKVFLDLIRIYFFERE